MAGREDLQGLQVLRGRLGAREGRQVEARLLVHQARALRLQMQEELQGQDQALPPTTEEDAIMAVEQLLLIDLVPVHL